MTNDEGHDFPAESWCMCQHTDRYHRKGNCNWLGNFGEKCRCTTFQKFESLNGWKLDLIPVLLPRKYIEWRASKSGHSLNPELFAAVVRKCQEALDGQP